MYSRYLLAIFVAAITASPVCSQQTQQSSTPRSEAGESDRSEDQPDDIIVEGYRLRGDVRTTVRPLATVSGARIRQTFAYSERLARCAARSKLSNLVGLHAVVDGEFNSATQALAQDRLKRTYITCSESPNLLNMTTSDSSASTVAQVGGTPGVGGVYNEGSPLGHSIYDRGAFVIAAMKEYAPNLRLSKGQTADRTVQARFNLREIPRNRFRLPTDFRYFEVAVCMVRIEPEISVRLAMSDGSARLGDLQSALIDRARVCVGNAKKVQVDPTQFRIYIADAVYRWAVAAQGVDSLIPNA